jgi:hypothetical protein
MLPITVVALGAQPEHAIAQSSSPPAAKDHQSASDAQEASQIRVTVDEDARDGKADAQHDAKCAILSSEITNRFHAFSPFWVAEFIRGLEWEALHSHWPY